tara:strand:+ start:248 stop:1156 length:909 start_codon:yes stop_codon:yes gene_type:complete
MIVYKNFNIGRKFKQSVIAIGNFDGLHLGHLKVLNQAKKKAREKKLKFGVVTFEPVPVMYFNKQIKNHRINNLDQKIDGLKKLKIDFLNIIKFNKNFSRLSPDQFIKKIIFKALKCKYIFVSKNFRFGKDRKGDVKKLKEGEKIFFYQTIITKPLKKNKKVLSSSYIRSLLTKGKLNEANKFLGRSWSIEGKVIKGSSRGRKIGYPTCNIKLEEYILPKLGVYSVSVKIGKVSKKGIANIGYRPTFKGKTLLLEVNIFGLKSNLYKKILRINFIKFIRPEKKFNNIEELKLQIKKDIKKIKN